MAKAKVIGGTLNVRKGPSKENLVVMALPDGEEVEVFETEGDWSKIRHGYVMTQYLESIPEEEKTAPEEEPEQPKAAPKKQTKKQPAKKKA